MKNFIGQIRTNQLIIAKVALISLFLSIPYTNGNAAEGRTPDGAPPNTWQTPAQERQNPVPLQGCAQCSQQCRQPNCRGVSDVCKSCCGCYGGAEKPTIR
jgi:hypothetical protein